MKARFAERTSRRAHRARTTVSHATLATPSRAPVSLHRQFRRLSFPMKLRRERFSEKVPTAHHKECHLLEIRHEPDGAARFRATIKHVNATRPTGEGRGSYEWCGRVHVERGHAKNDEVSSQKRCKRLARAPISFGLAGDLSTLRFSRFVRLADELPVASPSTLRCRRLVLGSPTPLSSPREYPFAEAQSRTKTAKTFRGS